MKELHRLIEGQFNCKDVRKPIKFGFVFEDEGRLQIEIYFDNGEKSFLFELMSGQLKDLTTDDLSINATSDKGEILTILRLKPYHINQTNITKVKFICQNKLICEKPFDDHFDKDEHSSNPSDTIYFIELEGLQLQHLDHTEQQTSRPNSSLHKGWMFPEIERDHTTFSINLLDGNSTRTFFGELHNHIEKDNGNQLLWFKDYIPGHIYKQNEDSLIQFFSFINGGEVRIRKIYTGKNYSFSPKGYKAQRTETFSFKRISNKSNSTYLPINEKYKSHGNELIHLFSQYENFITETKELDFKSVIYYLNTANENNNMEQKIFTLIIAAEELGDKYLKRCNPQSYAIIPDTQFDSIKNDLKKTFENYKGTLTNETYNNLLSRLCSINFQRIDTEEKFFQLFKHAGIAKTAKIERLVKQRHTTIHTGDIGGDHQSKWNLYYEYDHLLRDIILNRIGYKGQRLSKLA